MKRSTTKAVRDRLMISTALIALAALAPVSIAFAESGGDGGLRSSTTFPGGEGGESQTTGQGEDGGTGSVFTTGGGGGGAGETGGSGGAQSGSAALGGQSAGADGEDGASSRLIGGNGGGGGAHGGVGVAFPVADTTGGTGGNGGNGTTGGAGSSGGGGGAGGYGYVVTGDGALGTLSANIAGGAGGDGGDSFNPFNGGAQGGDGGKGLVVSSSAGSTFTISNGVSVSGGQGGQTGAADSSLSVAPSSGGTGLEGANLNVTLAGTVAGGAGSDGALANAFNFTGGTNTLSIASTGIITGGIRTDGALDIAHDDATYTLSNIISGTGSISKSDSGTLILTGANTYSGGTTIAGGTLSVSADNTLGASSGIIVLEGGTLATTASFASARDVSLLFGTGGNDINVAASTEFALSGDISGGFGFAKTGDGTLVLSGDNTFLGYLNIREGVVNIRSDQALGGAFETAVRDGAALELEGNITTGETVVLFGDGVSSDGAIRNASGANTISGDLVLNADSRVNSEAGTLTLAGEINGETGGGSPLNADLALGGAGNGVVSGTFGSQIIELLKDGAGTWTLSGNNLHTGQTTIRAGALRAESGAALGSAAQGTLVQNGGALELAGGINIANETLALNGTGVSNGGALRNISGNNTYGGDISVATEARIHSDADRLTLAGAIDATGVIFLGGAGDGTISGALDTTALLGKYGAGTWTFSGADKTVSSFRLFGGELIVDNASVTQNGFQTIVGLGTTVSTLTINGPNASWTGARDFSVGAAGGQGRLEILGGGTLSTDTSNIGNGGPSSGSALVSGSGSSWTATDTFFHGLSTVADLTVADGGEVSANTFHIALNRGAEATTLVTGAGSQLSATGDFTLGYGGQGSLTLAEGGTASVSGGTGQLVVAREAGSVGTLNIGAARGNTAAGVGTVSAASVQFGAGDGEIVFNHTGTDYDFAPSISGNGDLSFLSGKTTLTGNNTYTGNTTISGPSPVSGAVLNVQSDTALGAASGSIDIESSGVLELEGGVSVDKHALNISGARTGAGPIRNVSGDNTFTGVVNLGGTTNIGAEAGSLTLSGGVSGNGVQQNLTIIGSGDTTIGGVSDISILETRGSGTLTLSGTSTVNAGVGIIDGEIVLRDGTMTRTAGRDLIGTSGGSGVLTVTGPNATYNANDMSIGVNAGGLTTSSRLQVLDGGRLTASRLVAGDGAGASGAVLVRGAGSSFSADTLIVGASADGQLDVLGGASVESDTVFIALGSAGTANVSGAGSILRANTGYSIGAGGAGTLTLSDGGVVQAGDGTGRMNVGQGTFSTLNVGAADGAAAERAGAFNVGTIEFLANGGELVLNHTDTDYVLSSNVTGNGTLRQLSGTSILTGPNTYTGGTQISGGTLQVGDGGTGASIAGDIVNNAGLVFDFGDQLDLDGDISGSGTLTKRGSGTLTLSGNTSQAGGLVVSDGRLFVNGQIQAGDVLVQSGGLLSGSGSIIPAVSIADGGTLAGAAGRTLNMASLDLSGGSIVRAALGAPTTTALFDITGDLTLDGTLNAVDAGGYGAGIYRIMTYGGALTDNGLETGTSPAGFGRLDVQTGIANEVNLVVNPADTGTPVPPGPGPAPAIQFWDGANTTADGAINGGAGTWDLASSNWTRSNGDVNDTWNSNFAVFQGASGTVTVDAASGAINTTGLQFADDGFVVDGDGMGLIGADGQTTIRVGDGTQSGAGMTATVASALSGDSQLVKTDLGTLILTGANTYTGGTEISEGTLQIGDGGTGAAISGDVVNNAGLVFDFSDQLDLDGDISGSGTLTKQGAGTLTLSGNTSQAGGLVVSDGRLFVNGQIQAGDVLVQSGGLLSGSGSIIPAVSIADGGTLAGAAGRTLNMASLDLSGGSIVRAALGAPTTTALFDITGDLTLDGTLNAVDAGGYGAGIYRIMTYGGALTDNGLETGTSPAGFGRLDVQTGIANEVNLVVNPADTGTPVPPGPGPAPAIQFWDGANTTADGAINGGAGTWDLASSNWTRSNGDVNDTWNSNFAVFQGASGTVTVDAASGAINTTGLQFADDGFVVDGDGMGLIGADGQTTIRVGDGTQSGAGMTATVASALSGDSQLVKTDLGTLILTGANTYTGGTLVSDGTLVGSSSSIAGDVINNAQLVFDQATTGTFANTISGSGRLTKQGNGTLTLTGANTYSGGTEIALGTLSVSSDANLGASSGALSFSDGTLATTGNITTSRGIALNAGATIETASATSLEMTGTLSGAGRLTKQGNGTLTLTGANTYTGGTLVSDGTLVGSSASIAGDVTNNAQLVFDQATTGTFANTISGSGRLTKQGAGTLTLMGANTYTGGTLIFDGTLVGSSASIAGDVTNNAQLVFDQATAGTFAKTISGSGRLTKQGNGTLTLTGANTHTGGTEIAAGTLSVSSDANLGASSGRLEFAGGTLRTTASFDASRSALVSGEGVIDTVTGTRLRLLGDLTGTGTVTKTGSGTLVLDGDSAFEGMTDVKEGHLIVGDSAGSGARLVGGVTIGSGAYLSGSGSVGTTVVEGTVQPGNSIGTITIAGDARFTSGSVYEVEVDPSGTASDLIDVSGSVTIENGAAVRHIGFDGIYAAVSDYTIVTAGNGITGTFGSVESDYAFLDATLGYDTNAVTLTLSRNDIALADVAATRNQRAAAAGVEGLGFGNALYGVILTQDGPTARYAYDQVSGELHASLKSALIADSQYPRQAALGRLHTDIDNAAPQASKVVEGVTIWGDAYNAWGRMNGDGNTASMSHDTEGLLVGADANLSSGWRAGVLAGVSYSDQDVDARFSAANGEGAHLGAYGGGQWGRVSVNAGAIYAWHDIETRRAVLFANVDERVRGQMDAQTRQAFGEVSYDAELAGVDVQPFAELSYIELETDGLTESGDMAALHVAGDTTDATFSTLGTRARFPVELGNVAGSLTGKIGWQHGFGDLMPNAANTLAGSATYRVQGVHLARDSGVVGAGLDLALSQNARLAVAYEGSFNEDNTQQAITARVGVRF